MKENFQLVHSYKLSTDFVVLTSRKGSKTQKTDDAILPRIHVNY